MTTYQWTPVIAAHAAMAGAALVVGAAVLACGLIPLAWEASRGGARLTQGPAGRSTEA